MKTFRLHDLYDPEFGEYILGSRVVRTHGIYLVYGEAAAGERRTMGSEGHEELLLLLSGSATVAEDGDETPLEAEQAVYLGPHGEAVLTARTDCRYVVAGGHAEAHSHG